MKKFLIVANALVLLCVCSAKSQSDQIKTTLSKTYGLVYEWKPTIGGTDFLPDAKNPVFVTDTTQRDKLFSEKNSDATKSMYSYNAYVLGKNGNASYRIIYDENSKLPKIVATWQIYLGTLKTDKVDGYKLESKRMRLVMSDAKGDEVYSGSIGVTILTLEDDYNKGKVMDLEEIKLVHRDGVSNSSGGTNSSNTITAKLNRVCCRQFSSLPNGNRAPTEKNVTLCPGDAIEKFKSVKENGLDENIWTYLCNAALMANEDSTIKTVRIFYLGDKEGDYIPYYKDKGIVIYFGPFHKTPDGYKEKTGTTTVEIYDKDGNRTSSERMTLTALDKSKDVVNSYVFPWRIRVVPITTN